MKTNFKEIKSLSKRLVSAYEVIKENQTEWKDVFLIDLLSYIYKRDVKSSEIKDVELRAYYWAFSN